MSCPLPAGASSHVWTVYPQSRTFTQSEIQVHVTVKMGTWRPGPEEISAIVVGAFVLILCVAACYTKFKRATPASTRPRPGANVNAVSISDCPRLPSIPPPSYDEEGDSRPSTPTPAYEELDPENLPLSPPGSDPAIQLPPPVYSASPSTGHL